MTNMQAKAKMEKYLKGHFIKYQEDEDDGISRFTLLYRGCENCPDQILEGCIWFYPDVMECRVYYDCNGAQWCRESEHRDKLVRVLNFCNARVWIGMDDGEGGALYRFSYLYTPRFYLTEDDCFDITLTTMIPLDFYELAQLETEDFITGACPELMDRLSIPIFSVLHGKASAEQAIRRIKAEILGENGQA